MENMNAEIWVVLCVQWPEKEGEVSLSPAKPWVTAPCQGIPCRVLCAEVLGWASRKRHPKPPGCTSKLPSCDTPFLMSCFGYPKCDTTVLGRQRAWERCCEPSLLDALFLTPSSQLHVQGYSSQVPTCPLEVAVPTVLHTKFTSECALGSINTWSGLWLKRDYFFPTKQD